MSGPVGFRIFTKVKRAEPALVEAFRDLPVCNIDDSMNKIAGAHSAIKPLNSVKLLGTAITVKAPIGDNLMFHQAISMAQAGDVIVVDGGDSAALAAFDDFTIFARGVMANASFKGLGPGEINVPVCIGGMVVYPGDIIVGDEDGVVAIRPQHAQEIAEAARRLKEQEEANLQLILQGKSDRSWVMKALTEKGCTFIDKAWDEE